MPSADEKRAAYAAGRRAYRDRASPLANPYTPAETDAQVLLARLWRAGWHAEKRKHEREAQDND